MLRCGFFTAILYPFFVSKKNPLLLRKIRHANSQNYLRFCSVYLRKSFLPGFSLGVYFGLSYFLFYMCFWENVNMPYYIKSMTGHALYGILCIHPVGLTSFAGSVISGLLIS